MCNRLCRNYWSVNRCIYIRKQLLYTPGSAKGSDRTARLLLTAPSCALIADTAPTVPAAGASPRATAAGAPKRLRPAGPLCRGVAWWPSAISALHILDVLHTRTPPPVHLENKILLSFVKTENTSRSIAAAATIRLAPRDARAAPQTTPHEPVFHTYAALVPCHITTHDAQKRPHNHHHARPPGHRLAHSHTSPRTKRRQPRPPLATRPTRKIFLLGRLAWFSPTAAGRI